MPEMEIHYTQLLNGLVNRNIIHKHWGDYLIDIYQDIENADILKHIENADIPIAKGINE